MKNILILAIAVILVGCKVGPNYRAPQTALPAAYTHATTAIVAATNAPSPQLAEWWAVFNDERRNRRTA